MRRRKNTLSPTDVDGSDGPPDERLRLDVADRAADLGMTTSEAHRRRRALRMSSTRRLISSVMRDDLHGLPQVISAATPLGDHRRIHLPVVTLRLRQADVEKAP